MSLIVPTVGEAALLRYLLAQQQQPGVFDVSATGRLTPDCIEAFVGALALTAGRLEQRFHAFERCEYDDGETEDVRIDVRFVALRCTPLDLLKLEWGGDVPPPSRPYCDYVWSGYGFGLDGKNGGFLAHSAPVKGDRERQPCDWDVWLPHHDLPALRAAMKTGVEDVRRRATGQLTFMDGSRVACPVTVDFANPVALFSSMTYSAMRIEATVPDEVTRCNTYPLAAVALVLDGLPKAISPILPQPRVKPGDTVNHLIEV